MNINQLLEKSTERILREASEALKRVDLRNYQKLSSNQVEKRMQVLLEKTKSSVKEMNLMPMVVYAGDIAIERFNSGYELHDIQTAFNVLEEAIWRLIFEEVKPSELNRPLGLVSTVLGTGRDAFARAFVTLASKKKVRTLDLRTAFDGTVDYPDLDY